MKPFHDKIEPYLLNELAEDERAAFEAAMQTDVDLAKSVSEHQEMMQRLEAPCLGTLFCLESTVGVTPTEAEAAILAAQLDVPRLLQAFGPMKKQS